ncbi:MAG: PD-(D/E)XK nuclease family protein [Clostridia bacterium]|nr:PD-(D/E)XK nuclease family protein [Clostridia bacterium]
MLRIIRTNLNSSGSRRLENEISERVEKRLPTYLIVPEQDTVMREAASAKNLPPHAPLCFEVTNFTRLADSVFRTLGGITGDFCSSGKRALIIWRALTELSPVLSLTKSTKTVSAAAVASITRAIGEIKSAGITPENLLLASEEKKIKSDARLSSKLRDLASVYALYKNLLSENGLDGGESTEAVIKKLSENPSFLSNHTVYIDGFTSFTEPQYRLIGLLSNRCTVEVYLPLPKGCDELFEYTEIRGAIEKLKRISRLYSSDVQIKHSYDLKSEFEENISSLCNALWRKNASIDKITLQNAEQIRIFEAQTPFEMCEFVASDIKRRIISGSKYRDFAIVARSTSSYLGILDTALDYASIPHFFSAGTDASTFEAIKLIYTAYSVIRTSFAREDVITYMKCAHSGISREALDELEMYVNTWQISGSRFYDGTLWNMNPDGYTTRRSEKGAEMLVRINETKNKLIAPLISFKDAVAKATTVREHAEALLSLLLELNLEEALEERAKKLASLKENSAAVENLRLWRLICDTLDTLVELTGDLPCDTDAFLTQFKILISEEQIGKIPSYTDRVTVGSADMLRLSDKKHIYLIGMSAGEFPHAPSESSFFSERDKLTLHSLGLSLEPEMETKNARELFILTRALSYASESVTLLYSSTSTRFKGVEPSEALMRISEISSVSKVKISSLSALERIFTPEAALTGTTALECDERASIDEALKNSGYSEILSVSKSLITNPSLKLSKEITDGLYSRPMSLTQSRIDSFRGCPLEYFCKFTLKLGEEKIASFDSAGIGSFIHAILENFFSELTKNEKNAKDLSAEERKNLTMAAARKYIMELGEDAGESSPVTKIKLSRLTRAALPIVDGLCEEFSDSKFKPLFFELKIQDGISDSPSPIKMRTEGGHDISVYGTIDRVDTYKSDDRVYVRVVDYKTGSKDFSPEDLDEGKNLQMFLYLKSILDTKNREFIEKVGEGEQVKILPAGVIYVKSSVADTRVSLPSDELARQKIKDGVEREGMVLDDEEVISAMGLKYTPLYSSRYPDKITDAKKKYLFSENGFDTIMKTVEGAVGSIADKIADGDASATPKEINSGENRCEWCKFKPICRMGITK